MSFFWWIPIGLLVLLVVLGLLDALQKEDSILRNFPLIGRMRAILQRLGPPLRQYIVSRNDEERPFSRDERRWIYTSAQKENSYFGFGTDNDLELEPNYVLIKHRAFPLDSPHPGEAGYDRALPGPVREGFRCRAWPRQSIPPALGGECLCHELRFAGRAGGGGAQPGCAIAGCLHNTGEGGVSLHHLHGADLILQLGTAYFGSRGTDGKFWMPKLKETVARYPQIRAIEIKLSQGAKPALGGMLPASEGHARDRGGAWHPCGRGLHQPGEALRVQRCRQLARFRRERRSCDRPAGRDQIGGGRIWNSGVQLADLMADGGRGVDFITIDGGEGGTGAGTAGLHRPRRPAVQDRLPPRLWHLGRARVAATA